MTFIQLSGWPVFCCLFSCCYSHGVFADTIYQWTDPWGQVQYSTTPESGSMVSELTEMPHIEESSEQQKQEAMLSKMQKMKNANVIRRQKKSAEKFLKQQSIRNENHCRKLRNILADVQLRNTRKYYLDNYYFPGVHTHSGRAYNSAGYGYYTRYPYNLLEKDLHWEIRAYCR